MSGLWKTRIGLEVHVRLASRSKLFCACPNLFETNPNVHICPVCTGQPGSLPALGRGAVELALRAAVLFDFDVAMLSRFDRKHYFYPDLPKGYQVTQQEVPLGRDGQLEIEVDGRRVRIPLSRIHIEEDAGRSVHSEEHTRIDFNRAGAPLVEIVTDPVMETAQEVGAFLRRLREELRYAGVSDGDMDKGSMRTDVNISVYDSSRLGRAEVDAEGPRVEIKNLNSIRAAQDAVDFEVARQIQEAQETIRRGAQLHSITVQTRRWVASSEGLPGHSKLMRTKASQLDYRFLEDPDLLPLALLATDLDAARAMLPEGPLAMRDRWRCEYDLSAHDAEVLSSSPQLAAYFEATARALQAPVRGESPPARQSYKAAANWIINDLASLSSGFDKVAPFQVAALVRLVESAYISHKSGRLLLSALVARHVDQPGHDGDLLEMAQALDLELVNDSALLDEYCYAAMARRKDAIQSWQAGRLQAADALLGEAMMLSRGKAAPDKLRARLLALLEVHDT